MSITARQTAFSILLKIEKDKAYSNIALDSAVRELSLDSTDCAFISRLVYGVTERKITLDYVISQFLNQPIKKLKAEVLVILRIGTYQILYMDKIPDSAAVNESVSLAKNNKSSYASGVVNAVLRKVSLEKENVFKSLSGDERLSILYSAPIDLVRFLKHHYNEENAEEILKSALNKKEITIRVNTLKTTQNELIEILEKENISTEKTSLKDALIINTKGAVYELDAYKKGFFYVEDVSSQLCVKELDLKENYKLIDICSAPGGKSFTASQYMNNTGKIYSCDIHKHRVELIQSGAQRLGIKNIIPTVNDATIFNEEFINADCVLCDVPCSGLGIIGKKPEIKYKSLDEIKELIPIQKEILSTASKYVKKGGTLIYSTCSINPNENRKICDWFLKENEDFYSVKVSPETERCIDEGDYLTLLPHINNCDGFFIAKFIKK
ncbi:MAG: 16S rRNA (cytosine(967)-C(5))-methyltransferase RsmB [Ruminococcaceae bacterium]|nr:16S rRNA (cytosine(967)-C(5))-methyltransferase RsmB [Oscillospiraceae bacterium]